MLHDREPIIKVCSSCGQEFGILPKDVTYLEIRMKTSIDDIKILYCNTCYKALKMKKRKRRKR